MNPQGKVIGIVGSEASKFTSETEALARQVVIGLLTAPGISKVVSGGCHLGGIDIWAIEEATKLGLATKEFLPTRLEWSGYKQRNLQIAQASDLLVCITVKSLPRDYIGMRFAGCYHCKTPPGHHVKSGGCWTMKQAKILGKETKLIVIGGQGHGP